MEDVESFYVAMSGMNIPKLNVVSDKARWYSAYRDIERLRVRKGVNIEKEFLVEDMKKLGVKSGNIWDASPDQLEKYLSYIKAIEFPDKPANAYLYKYELESMNISRTKAQLYGRGLPVDIFLEKIGLRDLADKMRSHAFLELEHIAGGYVAFEEGVSKIYGKIGLRKVKNQLWLLDRKRYEDALADGTLSSSDKRFISNAVNKDWTPNLNTREGRVAARYKEFTKYYKDAYLDSLKQHMTPAEFEKYIDSGAVKWIEDGFYVSRILTKEFKRKYNLGSKKINDYIQDESWKLANEEAVKNMGKMQLNNKQLNLLKHLRLLYVPLYMI